MNFLTNKTKLNFFEDIFENMKRVRNMRTNSKIAQLPIHIQKSKEIEILSTIHSSAKRLGTSERKGTSRLVLLPPEGGRNNILYFLLNLIYHSKLKFIQPKFGEQKHLNFASESARCVMRRKEPKLIIAGRLIIAGPN